MHTRARRRPDEPERERRPVAAAPLPAEALLALQRTAGNASVARLLGRQPATLDAPADQLPYQTWTKPDVKPIQRELRRLRLYNLGLDGIIGKVSDQGLVEAFGGDEWRTLDAATVLSRLQTATRPKTESGHELRMGELLKDGLLDLTFGYGFMEELDAAQWDAYAKEMETALTARGYTEDAKRAEQLYATVHRTTSGFGRFFVKEDALTYSPPAGSPRTIPAIVRFIMNPGGDKGAEAREAFEQGMAQGDVAYYSGHGRYGSGPDFDRNFGKFTLLDKDGHVTDVFDDYEVMARELAKHGDPWQRFLQLHAQGRLEVEFSNAGNLRLNKRNMHPGEFGAKLINWALEQTGEPVETGAGGDLATDAAATPDRKYRVLVFDGCRSQDYEASIRKTPGFDTRGADIIGTRREVGFGAEAEAFMAFLDGLVGQHSAETIVKDMNQQMKENEAGYTSAPFAGDGLADNPSQ